ncbi:MAG: DMT family transporter [Chloroflexi bacterium]|nr:DMT family transporter [Chloroflexota bacterium]
MRRGTETAAPAIALVLVAAFFHASWNFVLHDAGDRNAVLAVGGLASGVVFLPAIVLFPPWHAWPYIVASACAETAYALCLAAAYARGQLSLAYPIGRGSAPLLVTLAGWLVLTQPPAPLSLTAAILLIVGMALIATANQHRTERTAVAFAVLTGACIATYSTIDARAVASTEPIAYLGVVMGLQGLLLTVICKGELPRLRASFKPGILVGIGSLIAYVLVLFAFQRAPAGRVATLREVSVLLGLLLAKRRSGCRVWIGAACVVLGAILAAT